MLEFFLGLDATMQVAIISLCGAVIVAIINGFFQLISSRKKNDSDKQVAPNEKTIISQNINGHHNTVIGIQNNKKNGE